MSTKLALSAATLVTLALSTAAGAFEPIISMPGEQRQINPPGGNIDVLATRDNTDGQFGIIVLNSKPGEGPGPAITHYRGSQSLYVIEGTYEFHIGDKVFDGGPGTFVSIDVGQSSGFIGKTDGKILIVFQPGGYEQFFLEWNQTQVPKGPEAGALEEKYGVTRP